MKRMIALVLVICLLCPVCVYAQDGKLEEMLEKAVQFVNEEDYDSAEICYDIAMKLSPDDPHVLEQTAWMYFLKGEMDKAQNLIETAIDLTPAEGSLYLAKARIMLSNKRSQEAFLAVRYAEICGTDVDEQLFIEVAASCMSDGFYTETVELFELAEQELWWEKYLDLYGRALVHSGELERAKQLGLIKVGVKEEALANAIQKNQDIRLSVWTEDISDYPVFCPSKFLEANKETIPAEVYEDFISDGEKVRMAGTIEELGVNEKNLLAVSPSGEAALYSFDGVLVMAKQGELLVITPDYPEYLSEEEKTASIYEEYFRFGEMFEQDSIVWSPDERYFTLTFPNQALYFSKLYDLMLVDTETGILSVVEPTPIKITEDGSQAAVSACFDEEGESVYYLVFGRIGTDSRCGLKKYNITAGSSEMLCEVKEMRFCYAGIYMDCEGNIRGITDSRSPEDHGGTILFSEKENGWTYDICEFSNPLTAQRPTRYLYSANSHMEMALNRNVESLIMSYYMTLNTDVWGKQMDNLAVLLPKSGNTAELMEINEVSAAIREMAVGEEGEETEVPMSNWLNITNAVFSPDGYYALIQANNQGKQGIYILDIQSMRFVQLDIPDDVGLIMTTGTGNSGKRLEWISNDKILLPCMNGNVVCHVEISST